MSYTLKLQLICTRVNVFYHVIPYNHLLHISTISFQAEIISNRLFFEMTITKSQGQTLASVGNFSHDSYLFLFLVHK